MTKHRSPDERRAQILTAARRCFVDHGYTSTTIDDIALQCGLSKGGIYFHFPSKKEIFRSLVHEEFDASTTYIDQVMTSGDPLASRLFEVGTHFLEQFIADPDQSRFMLVVAKMALHDEATHHMLLHLQTSYIERISALLEEGIADGALRPMDTESTAIILKAMLDGIQASIAVGYSPDLERLLPAAVDLLTAGLFPQPEP